MMKYFANNSNRGKKCFNNWYVLIDTNLSVVEMSLTSKKVFRNIV